MNKPKRLLSLDTLRGVTIAGMILVNVPGSWSHIYKPFRHAEFNGLSIADLVFPFFLFIVGASIVLALGKRFYHKVPKPELLKKVLYRTIVIFVLGIFLNWLSDDFSFPLRIAGVLQRIAFCYLAVSLLYIYTTKLFLIGTTLFLLIGYWILTIFIPIPGEGLVFTPEMNWTAWVDGRLLPGKMYFGAWDPEGILSTLPAIASTLTGMLATIFINQFSEMKKKIVFLSIFGSSLVFAGLLLAFSFPINKNVWSSSFVLVTSGLASIIWSVFIYVVDLSEREKGTNPGIIFGANAIAAYVLHYLLAYPLGRWQIGKQSIQGYFMDFCSSFMAIELASLIWAVLFVFLCYLPIWILYRKKIFIKI
ncbi:MAG: DUF5009 domain-containing protein [Prolixibacteraceae bacterium]|jgi:predicted acyltransferase|nr:DUF5009 domain-containing protein [Prolixibacteraceae bacterium]